MLKWVNGLSIPGVYFCVLLLGMGIGVGVGTHYKVIRWLWVSQGILTFHSFYHSGNLGLNYLLTLFSVGYFLRTESVGGGADMPPLEKIHF